MDQLSCYIIVGCNYTDLNIYLTGLVRNSAYALPIFALVLGSLFGVTFIKKMSAVHICVASCGKYSTEHLTDLPCKISNFLANQYFTRYLQKNIFSILQINLLNGIVPAHIRRNVPSMEKRQRANPDRPSAPLVRQDYSKITAEI